MSTAPAFELIPTSFGSSTLRLVPVLPATKSAREQLAEARSRRAKKTAAAAFLRRRRLRNSLNPTIKRQSMF